MQGLSKIFAYLNGSGISNLRWVALTKGLPLIKVNWKKERSDRGIGFAPKDWGKLDWPPLRIRHSLKALTRQP